MDMRQGDPRLALFGWMAEDATLRDPQGSTSASESLASSDREAFLTLAQSTASLGYWSWDLISGTVWRSDSFFRLHGLRRGSLGDDVEEYLSFVHPEDRASLRERALAAAVGDATATEYRFIHPEGGVRHLIAHAAIVRDRSGTAQRLVGTVQDITTILRARRDVSEAFTRLSAYFEEMPTPAYLWTQAGDDLVLRRFNRAAREQGGERARQLTGALASVVCADEPEVLASLHECLRRQEPMTRETDFKSHRGTRRLVITYVPVAADAVVAHTEDITDRRSMESALRRSHDAARGILDACHQPIVLCEADGTFVAANAAVGEVLGVPSEELIGHPMYDFFDPDTIEGRRAAVEKVVEGRKAVTLEDVESGRDFRARLYPVIDDSGEVVRVVIYAEDVTEERRSHEALRALTQHLESVREEERVQVARDLHDELGSVLTALRIDIAEVAAGQSSAERDRTLAVMASRVDQAIEVGRRVTARLRPGILDDLGLAAAVEWLCEDLEKRTGVRCQVFLPESGLDVEEPVATAMFRILQEALTNVIRHAEAERVEVELQADGGRVSLTVADSGRGFDPDTGGRAGLGLLGMRERVRALDGSLDVESEPGRGTRIRVVLPMATKQPPTP